MAGTFSHRLPHWAWWRNLVDTLRVYRWVVRVGSARARIVSSGEKKDTEKETLFGRGQCNTEIQQAKKTRSEAEMLWVHDVHV
jgi:hypothetical protein